MKILVIKSIFLLVVASFIILLATQCKKEPTEITAIITVKYQNDTNMVVSFADVVIGETGQDVMVQGKADALGQYSHVFKLEAILKVWAGKDTNTTGPAPDMLDGEGVIRLKPGETVYKTVFIR